MLLDRKPFVFLWAPLYQFIFGQVVWPFIARVKVFFFAETIAELALMQQRLELLEAEQRKTAQFLADFRDHQREQSAAHWSSMEDLLLCMLREPDRLEPDAGAARDSVLNDRAEPGRAHAGHQSRQSAG